MLVSTTTRETLMTVTRSFIITEGEPVIPMAYSQPPKQVRIKRGTIHYTWIEGGWAVKDEYSVSLSGTVLKKDGSPSKNEHTRHPASARGSWNTPHLVLAEGWEWLDEIISLLRPTGDLTFVRLDDHEVGA